MEAHNDNLCLFFCYLVLNFNKQVGIKRKRIGNIHQENERVLSISIEITSRSLTLAKKSISIGLSIDYLSKQSLVGILA